MLNSKFLKLNKFLKSNILRLASTRLSDQEYIENQSYQSEQTKPQSTTLQEGVNEQFIRLFALPENPFDIKFFSQMMSLEQPPLLMFQINPEPWLATQRQATQQLSANRQKGAAFEWQTASMSNFKIRSYHELIVNPLTLDLIRKSGRKEDIDMLNSFTFFSRNVKNSQKSDDKSWFKNLRDDQEDHIRKYVFGGYQSKYHDMNNYLMLGLLSGASCCLIDIPETTLRQQVANTQSLQEIKDMQSYVNDFVVKQEFKINFVDAANQCLPHVFQYPRDLQMISVMKQVVSTLKTSVAFVGYPHYIPVTKMFDIQGQHFYPTADQPVTTAQKIPDKMNADSLESLIEKHALLDSIFETQLWTREQMANPFQQLTESLADMNDKERKYCESVQVESQLNYMNQKTLLLEGK